MIHNKFRYLLTLVALFAMTTGAWATVYTSEVDSKVVKVGDILAGGVSLLPPSYVGECNLILGLGRFRSNKVEYTLDHLVYCGAINTIGDNAVILMNGAAPETFTPVDENGQDGNAWLVTGISGDGQNFIEIGVCGTYYDPNYDPSAIKVAWDKATKSGTFTMPGGNVTLAPEYYPQAALTAAPTAINDVPATTDGAIVKAGTVANIGSTETAQGTVMYYVSPTALDDAALLALAADQWTADVPTAESLAQGQAYVYYYVRGNDSDNDEENFSDGDILAANALTVTIAAAPTYAVTFAEGTADADKWTIEPTEAKPGTEVKATYSGNRHVKGVKAVKKAEAPSLVIEDKNNFFGIGNQKFYFTEGETWTEAMANHPENAAAGWVIYNDRLRFKPDVYGNAIFILRSGDYYIIEDKILNQPIDTSKTYSFSGTTPT